MKAAALWARLCSALTLTAGTAVAAQDIEGRWQTNAKDLVLDISRCGERFCGQAVSSNNKCERTILMIAANATSQTFDGELTVAGRANPYKVKVSLATDAKTAAASMMIVGDDVEPSLVRRTFPFRALLARAGNASCPSKPVS